MDLIIQTESGYSRTESFSIRIGNLSVVDPLGPDTYGYYIYDSNDTDYDLAPDYNWIDISSGLGTNLNLSNSGDGNWSGNGPLETVNLPFTFRFYGVDYNQMTVCTNGWISLGSTTSEAFRNYPIPGAGGPSPMIAAFWDDLETGNNGDVFVYNTNEYVIVQWDNMRTNWASSSETFQVILYNDSALPYGDNSIKIQYDDFNNTSVGSFSSYPPIHGSYATIGIENHLATDGLQYSYNNSYPTAAMTLSDNKAIYITTQAPITLPAPQLDLSDSSLDFEVSSGSSDTQELSALISDASAVVVPTWPIKSDSELQSNIGTLLASLKQKQWVATYDSYGGNEEPIDFITNQLRKLGQKEAFKPLRVRDEPNKSVYQQFEEAGTDLGQILTRKKNLAATKSLDGDLNKALGCLSGGLYIVTAKENAGTDSRDGAMVASWVSQASFEPPGITVAVAKDRAIESLLQVNDRFVLNILQENNYLHLFRHFLKRFPPGANRFKGVELMKDLAPGGPVLSDALAFLSCQVIQRLETTDHWIIYSLVEKGNLSNTQGKTAVHHRRVGSNY